MKSNSLNQSHKGSPVFPIQQNHSTKSILGFLEQWLPHFKEIYLASQTSHLEDEISEQLSLFLQDKANNQWVIGFNAKKGVDFGIFVKPYRLNTPPFFVIEAKRLPPTKNKDYVQGTTGGIERFKREQDGFGKHLSSSAMVAYVQDHDFVYWYNRINKWLTLLIEQDTNTDEIRWETCDKLKETKRTQQLARYTSTHSRKTQKNITLHHFWLNMHT